MMYFIPISNGPVAAFWTVNCLPTGFEEAVGHREATSIILLFCSLIQVTVLQCMPDIK